MQHGSGGTMPGVIHLDMNLSRAFTLNSKDKNHPPTLTLNARSANLLNHTNVTAVNTVLSSSAIGSEAIAEQGNLAVAFLEIVYCIDSVFDVPDAGVSVVSLIEAKAVVPVGLGGDVQVDARLLPPVQIWSD